MRKLPLLSIFFAHISVDMQTSSLTILLPLLLSRFDLNYGLAALIVSVNNAVIAVAQPLFGLLGDRRPLRWLIPVGALVCGAAMSSVTLQTHYALVLAAVILSGIGSAAFHPEGLSGVRAVSSTRVASATSFFFFGGNLGFALGPFLAAQLIAWRGIEAAPLMIAPTLLAGALLLTQYRALKHTSPHTTRTTHPRPQRGQGRVIGIVVFLLALIAVRSLVLSGLQTFIPLYFTAHSALSKETIGLIVSVLIFSGAFGTLLGGPLSERFGRRMTMAGAMVIVLGALFVFMHSEALIAQLASAAVAGAFITMPWPISVVMVQEAMPDNVGLASGLTLGLAYGASGLGVSALGVLADLIGLPAIMNLLMWMPVAVFVMSLLAPERVRPATT